MRDLRYWLLLQSVNEVGPSLFNKLLERFGEPEDIFSLDTRELMTIPRVSETIAENIVSSKERLDEMDNLLSELEDKEIRVTTVTDEDYPERLKSISNPPPVIYTYGNLDKKIGQNIAIVGARRASINGMKNAICFSGELAKKGFIIISGYAKGIDTAAHIGALKSGGNTVMVLPTGIFKFSLHLELNELRETIGSHATIFSEFFPLSGWSVGQAMARNRITVGLSDGVLVIEAGEKGGTINTAEWALKQKKPLFIISSDNTPVSRRLLNMGAIPVKNPEELKSFFDV